MNFIERLTSIEVENDIYILLAEQAENRCISLPCLLNGILSEWLLRNLRVETATTGLQTTRYLGN